MEVMKVLLLCGVLVALAMAQHTDADLQQRVKVLQLENQAQADG